MFATQAQTDLTDAVTRREMQADYEHLEGSYALFKGYCRYSSYAGSYGCELYDTSTGSTASTVSSKLLPFNVPASALGAEIEDL